MEESDEKIEFITIENIIDHILLDYYGAECIETGFGFHGKSDIYYNESTFMFFEIIFEYVPFCVYEGKRKMNLR